MPGKKMQKLAATVLGAFMVFALAGCGIRPIDPTAETGDNNAPVSSQIVRLADPARDIAKIEDTIATEALMVNDNDLKSIFDVYSLPKLERMETADADQYVNNLQSIKRVKAVGYDLDRLAYPEYWFKATYSDIIAKAPSLDARSATEFSGTKASELNAVLSGGGAVLVTSSKIEVD